MKRYTSACTPQSAENFVEVKCVALSTLLTRLPEVDVTHMDIQGAELDVLASSLVAINKRIRRLVIGTHGRNIEAQLLDLLAKEGWILEIETQCMVSQELDRWHLVRDGVQVWRNPKLTRNT